MCVPLGHVMKNIQAPCRKELLTRRIFLNWLWDLCSLTKSMLRCDISHLNCLLEGWSAQTRWPEASTSAGSNVWLTMMHRSTSEHTFTGEAHQTVSNASLLPSLTCSDPVSVLRVGRTARAGKTGLAFTFLLRVQVHNVLWDDESSKGAGCFMVFVAAHRRKTSCRWWWKQEALGFRSRWLNRRTWGAWKANMKRHCRSWLMSSRCYLNQFVKR